MNHVLPAEFTQTLSVLQDQAASRPYEDVVQAFQNELGIHPNEIFDNFERQAVAAASLAQVHKAQLRETGKQVAVKVQYPDMDDMFRGDIKTIEIMMNLIGRVQTGHTERITTFSSTDFFSSHSQASSSRGYYQILSQPSRVNWILSTKPKILSAQLDCLARTRICTFPK